MKVKVVVDSWGWIEYFTDGPLALKYARYLERPQDVLTPVIVVYEVYKKIKHERGEEAAMQSVAQLKKTEIIPLNDSVALSAANLSLNHGLPMADALILAAARQQKLKLVTSDPHFGSLEGVVFLHQ